jgi:glycosyltransferase involved in cell wall biosynthesis
VYIPKNGRVMDKPRIYIAIDTFLPLVGGAEKQAFLQGKYLREQGFVTTIITMHYEQDWPGREYLEGVPIVRVARKILSWHENASGVWKRFYYVLALLVLGWQLWRKRQEYDILHVFQLTLFTLPALLVCRLARKRLIVAMRNDASSWQIDELSCKRRLRTRADLESLEHLGRPALRLISHQLRLTRARLVVLSARMCVSLKRCGLEGAGVLLIPNGVNTIYFQPCLERRETSPLVICVAKLRYQKGLDVLLHAWWQVVKQVPRARLLIVGDGPLLVSLNSLADSLGIASSVEFTGFCTDVVQHLQRAHIAVLPSRWEGMPNALLEAMSCGLACVATRVSGSEDLLQESKYGLLVEPEDVHGLAEALLQLLRQPDLVRSYGQLARDYVEQHHTFVQVMDKYIKLYMQGE